MGKQAFNTWALERHFRFKLQHKQWKIIFNSESEFVGTMTNRLLCVVVQITHCTRADTPRGNRH